jgi:hypothetical protein
VKIIGLANIVLIAVVISSTGATGHVVFVAVVGTVAATVHNGRIALCVDATLRRCENFARRNHEESDGQTSEE